MIQIIQPSVNFLWVALASDWQKYFTYIDVLTQKQIGSLSTSKGYMNESFLLCNSKIYVLLIPLIWSYFITDRFNVAKFLNSYYI